MMAVDGGQDMDTMLANIFDEAIKMELNVARLYELFSELYKDSRDFWSQLANEERNHAALLQSGKDEFVQQRLFPAQLLCADLEQLQQVNRAIGQSIADYRTSPPSETEAFREAIELENQAQEYHFQRFMEKSVDSRAAKLFQRLCASDKDHALRIREYVSGRGISL